MKFKLANVNIALLKYWGKTDQLLNIPQQTSISVTADVFYTKTNVTFDKSLTRDKVILDDTDLIGVPYSRVVTHLDKLRSIFNRTEYCHVTSYNNVYMKAGFASSASAFAALTAAYISEAGVTVEPRELSKLARLGSGSASRSVFGGFVIWHKGEDHDSSYAEPLNIKWPEFKLIFTVLDSSFKSISSRIGMQLSVEKSPSYPAFVKQCNEMVAPMVEALKAKDFKTVGTLTERNADLMHNVMLEAGLEYHTAQTQKLIQTVKAIREKYKLHVYYTFDAGPNLILITLEEHLNKVLNYLPNTKTIISDLGGPIRDLIE